MEYLKLKPDVQGMVVVICPRCKRKTSVSPTTLYDVINHGRKITCSTCTNVFPFTEAVLNEKDRASYDRMVADWEAKNINHVSGTKLNIQIKI